MKPKMTAGLFGANRNFEQKKKKQKQKEKKTKTKPLRAAFH
jgi:hypothetical protein